MPRHFLSRLKQRSTTLRLAAGDNLAPATIRAIVLPALAALLSVIAAMHSPWGPGPDEGLVSASPKEYNVQPGDLFMER